MDKNTSLFQKPFFPASIWIALITIAGFWATYYGRLPSGVGDKSLIIHIHAVVYSCWLIILITQTYFAAKGQIQKHMAFGRVGIYWGWALAVTGLAITYHVFARYYQSDGIERASFELIFPLFDMLFFIPIFAMAVNKRKKPQVHKKLMMVAVTILLIAPVGRLFVALDLNPFDYRFALWILWVMPLIICQLYEYVQAKKISPIYISGIILIPLSDPFRLAIGDTDMWMLYTNWLANNFV